MTKRKRETLAFASLVLIGMVALALVTTWALLAIGEGTAAIKLKEYGGEFAFGGTFGLFIGLMGVFVRMFKTLIKILAGFLFLALGTQTRDYVLEPPFVVPLNIEVKLIVISCVIVGVAVVVWFTLKKWRDQSLFNVGKE